MGKISKAVIPVAGWGTRQIPITKTIEKAMLPVGGRPLVDYSVQDCIAAGIEDIIFVVSEQSEQIRSYYSQNLPLERYLAYTGKEDLLDLVRVPSGVRFHFVIQPADGKYGTAIPVALAAEQFSLKDEGAVVLMGDDFVYTANGPSEIARLLQIAGNESALLGVEIDRSQVGNYGVLSLGSSKQFTGIVEKPSPEDAPSNLINVSKYVMSGELIQAVQGYAQREDILGEWQIVEPITQYVQSGGIVRVVKAAGEYLDGGTPEGWLYANNRLMNNL